MPATAPGRCSRAGARVVALEPQRVFHAFLAPRPAARGDAAAARPPGRRPARARLAVSRLHPTVSSLAAGFAERMAAAPGFAGVRWDAAETVEVDTLDALIAAHGLPRFVKIDVEGFEAEVLAGLSAAGALGRLRVPAGGARHRRRLRRPARRARALRVQPRRRRERLGFALADWHDAGGDRRRPSPRAPATGGRATSTPGSAAMSDRLRRLGAALSGLAALGLLYAVLAQPAPARHAAARRALPLELPLLARAADLGAAAAGAAALRRGRRPAPDGDGGAEARRPTASELAYSAVQPGARRRARAGGLAARQRRGRGAAGARGGRRRSPRRWRCSRRRSGGRPAGSPGSRPGASALARGAGAAARGAGRRSTRRRSPRGRRRAPTPAGSPGSICATAGAARADLARFRAEAAARPLRRAAGRRRSCRRCAAPTSS